VYSQNAMQSWKALTCIAYIAELVQHAHALDWLHWTRDLWVQIVQSHAVYLQPVKAVYKDPSGDQQIVVSQQVVLV
jgi:hypothetical protein